MTSQEVQVWECKIVVPGDANLSEGFDLVPRAAAIKAVTLNGIPVLECFSGWGGKLTEFEASIVDRYMSSLGRQT